MHNVFQWDARLPLPLPLVLESAKNEGYMFAKGGMLSRCGILRIDALYCGDMLVAATESQDMWKVDVKLDSFLRLRCAL